MITAYEQSLASTRYCVEISALLGVDLLKWNKSSKRVEVDDSKRAKLKFFALNVLVVYICMDARPNIKKTKHEVQWSTILKIFEFVGTNAFHVFLLTFIYKSRYARSKLFEKLFQFDLDMERVYNIRYTNSKFEKKTTLYVSIYYIFIFIICCTLCLMYLENAVRKASVVKGFPAFFGIILWMPCLVLCKRIIDRIKFLGLQLNYRLHGYKVHGVFCK